MRILGLTWEPGFDPIVAPGFVASFSAALQAYLAFGAAAELVPPVGAAHRALFRGVAETVPIRRAGATATTAVARRAATT